MCCARRESRLLALGLSFGLSFGSTLSNCSSAQAASPAEPALTRIARTGRLTAGTRTDALPFAYRAANGAWAGYSVDLLERIRAAVELKLQRPVQLELVDADAGSLDLLTAGKVDLICGSTSYSQSRDLQADFSVGYFVTGTQLLINTEHDLRADFTIGVIADTTNQRLMRQMFPIAQLVTVASRAVGLQALQNERIDALASDGILLEAMRLSLLQSNSFQSTTDQSTTDQSTTDQLATNQAAPTLATNAYELVPDQPYDEAFYACLLPRDDAPLQQIVNGSLLAFMQGVLAEKPADLKTLETWFGEAGKVPLRPAAWAELLKYFQQQIDLQPAQSGNARPSNAHISQQQPSSP